MTTQVYARKWRPLTFSNLVGQDHISNTLKYAVTAERIANSYLFYGPRGTGKTSVARILSKAINCQGPLQGDPCNACISCDAINHSRSADVVEIDAASNRGINEIKSITDAANFMPMNNKKRVYIIDEAHMLTNQASNAFLKTLEEPPPHLVFILCTTEIDNIIPTIVSRCQRYDFKRLSSTVIYELLSKISLHENIDIADDALHCITRYADGSLRDAENLLEQISLQCNNLVRLNDIEQLLNIDNLIIYIPLVESLLNQNLANSLQIMRNMVWNGIQAKTIFTQILDMLLYAVQIKDHQSNQLNINDDVYDALYQITSDMNHDHIVRTLKIWAHTRQDQLHNTDVALNVSTIEICSALVDTPLVNNTIMQPVNDMPVVDNRNPIAENINIRYIWRGAVKQFMNDGDNLYNIRTLLYDYTNISLINNASTILVQYDYLHKYHINRILSNNENMSALIKLLNTENEHINNIEIKFNREKSHLVDMIKAYGGVIRN